jgi:hypothetical protein
VVAANFNLARSNTCHSKRQLYSRVICHLYRRLGRDTPSDGSAIWFARSIVCANHTNSNGNTIYGSTISRPNDSTTFDHAIRITNRNTNYRLSERGTDKQCSFGRADVTAYSITDYRTTNGGTSDPFSN